MKKVLFAVVLTLAANTAMAASHFECKKQGYKEGTKEFAACVQGR